VAAARNVLRGILLVLLVCVALTPSLVSTGMVSAQTRTNVCLTTLNTASYDIYFTVDGWNQYQWQAQRDMTYVTINNVPIVSANGQFTVRGVRGMSINTSNSTFSWRADYTYQGACNGSWLLTFH